LQLLAVGSSQGNAKMRSVISIFRYSPLQIIFLWDHEGRS
jgi:hypothetical protein